MDKKHTNLLNLIVPLIILIGMMTAALAQYPVIYEKSKWNVIVAFTVIAVYIPLWALIKPDRYSIYSGFIIGLLFIINISIEEFINWPSKSASLVSTLIMMFAIFISFSIVSAVKAIKTKKLVTGMISSFASSLMGTVIALGFGFLINYLFCKRMIIILRGFPGYNDFINPGAFIFYNAFNNASNHVIMVPIVSVIMGFIGGISALIILRMRKTSLNYK